MELGEGGKGGGRERERDAAAQWLQECVQDLVLEVFLPQVWDEARSCVTFRIFWAMYDVFMFLCNMSYLICSYHSAQCAQCAQCAMPLH